MGDLGPARYGSWPDWVPCTVARYLDHVACGQSLRALARTQGCHPSTVLRQVQRIETRRDDPLVDAALIRLCHARFPTQTDITNEDTHPMSAPLRRSGPVADEKTVTREARRILRRLSETHAVLAIAPGMDNAAVLKQAGTGAPVRVAVLTREVAEAFALKDWIAVKTPGKVTTYAITAAGRAALKRLQDEVDEARPGFAEAPMPFANQHREWDSREVAEDGAAPRRYRANMAESPLTLLARRRDKSGQPFLTPELVAAGERLREDFELAQMGPRVTQNWDRFLTAGDRGGFSAGAGGFGPAAARERVAAALRDLGPGLGDVALRCCCFLEGMETTEKRMGWSARSGKIVLRIALQQLKRHYDEKAGPAMIG